MKKNIKQTKNNKKANIILILGVVYTLITILAIISYVSDMNTISTTNIGFMGVIKAIWWQLLMIALFAITYMLYNKKELLGVLLEIIMGLSMLVYIVISVAMMGANLLAILIELIYPLLLIGHGLLVLINLNKTKKKLAK